eukprot:375774-Amphidinium_carterae.1
MGCQMPHKLAQLATWARTYLLAPCCAACWRKGIRWEVAMITNFKSVPDKNISISALYQKA